MTLPVAGLIFDLDGTLVDSALDFELMRREMGIPAGQPILEALDHFPESEALRCREILARHEWAGAERAVLMPGVTEFLQQLAPLGLHRALLTRNSRVVVERTLDRLGLDFEYVIAREDAPAKPDPTAILQICTTWQLDPLQVAMVGDYRFDLEAGRRAGTRTVLYTANRPLDTIPYLELADYLLPSFHNFGEFRAWLGLVG